LDPGVAYTILQRGDQDWEERPPVGGRGARHTLDVTSATGITESRARMWRLPPGSCGRRHAEQAQEEVFYVVSGTLTILLGDPPERIEVEAGGIVAVEPGTGIQLHNTCDSDAVVFAYGAPPLTGQVEYLDDITL
jgi:uncharacterized cupin superfamily protein